MNSYPVHEVHCGRCRRSLSLQRVRGQRAGSVVTFRSVTEGELNAPRFVSLPHDPKTGLVLLEDLRCAICAAKAELIELFCPCSLDDPQPVQPGYALCPTCLDIVQGNGIDKEVYGA